jgi:hypothetical protein
MLFDPPFHFLQLRVLGEQPKYARISSERCNAIRLPGRRLLQIGIIRTDTWYIMHGDSLHNKESFEVLIMKSGG